MFKKQIDRIKKKKQPTTKKEMKSSRYETIENKKK